MGPTLILWVVFGALAGAFVKVVFWDDGRIGLLTGLFLGAAGGCAGGLVRLALGWPVPPGFDLFTMFLALFGAAVLLWGYHRLFARRSRAQVPTRRIAA